VASGKARPFAEEWAAFPIFADRTPMLKSALESGNK